MYLRTNAVDYHKDYAHHEQIIMTGIVQTCNLVRGQRSKLAVIGCECKESYEVLGVVRRHKVDNYQP